MELNYSRRDFLGAMGMAAGAAIAQPAIAAALKAPASRVAIGQCQEYDRQVANDTFHHVRPTRWGGRARSGKTVAIKLNMTGPTNDKLNSMPNQMTHWVHPEVIGALVSLLGKAGAKRVRLLESAPSRCEAAGGVHAIRWLEST